MRSARYYIKVVRDGEGIINMLDGQGLTVSVSDQQVLADIAYFQDQFSGMKNDVGAVFAAAEAHPNVFILNVYAAAIKGYGQSERLMQAALPFLDRISDQYPKVTPREQQWFDAV